MCFLIWKIFNVRLEWERDFPRIYGTLATSNNGGHNGKIYNRLKPRRISEVLRMKNDFSNRVLFDSLRRDKKHNFSMMNFIFAFEDSVKIMLKCY